MENSVLFAKFIGIIYISFGIGILFNKNYYLKTFIKLVDDNTYLVLGGILAIIFGLLIIEFHNNWVLNWTVIITIFGWLALLKGIIILAFPKSVAIFKPLFETAIFNKIVAPMVLLFGLLFIYLGYFK